MKKQRLARRQRRAAQLALRKRLKKQGRRPALPEDRRGSVIVVVIALLSALMFLGFVFFSLSSQENENAEYFLEASKKVEPLDFDPNEIFDCFLEQLILGAPNYKYNSVFWGGRISLLPTMYGTDASAYNGEGTNAIWFDPDGNPSTPDGYPVADTDYDGAADNPSALWINLSPGALLDSTGMPYIGQNANQFSFFQDDGNPATFTVILPEPDVNYLAPDHNFPMLTYVAWTYGATSAPEPVVLPAGQRPQLLRNRGGGAWYSNAATLPFVLRPHQMKKAVNEDGVITGVNRYAGDFFMGQLTSVPNPVEGVWQNLSGVGNINYDADPTGRGVPNAVYLDCDFPIQTDPITGDQFVPLVAVYIVDGESRLNLNVAGNNNEYLVRPGGNTISAIPANQSLSRSNLGVSRSEINPLWPLLTDHTAALPAEQQPYLDYYGGWATTPTQLANMELLSILQGRAEITGGVATQAYAGRWGEPDLVVSNWNGSKLMRNFPKAGLSGSDDNSNVNEGRVPTEAFHPATAPPRVNPHPFDSYGVGAITGSDGYHRFLRVQGDLSLAGYKNYSFTNNNTADFFPYQTYFGGNLTTTPANRQKIDDPEEMVSDLRFGSLIQDDSPFGPGATASLQLTRTDLNQVGISSVLDNLAPYTFTQAPDEEEIRSRFTTISYEMKSHGANFVPASPRAWEWNGIVDVDFIGTATVPEPLGRVFPPTIAGATTSNPQPYRPELFELLMSVARDNRVKTLARKLSVNGVVDRVADGGDYNGALRVRPLIEHYINPTLAPNVPYDPSQELGATPITGAGITSPDPFSYNSLSPRQQEYFARFDRQRLCRDIYTLLYVLGHPNDSQNTLADNSGFVFYTQEQCREMAQFAVNLVDQMDTDDVVTMFQYDTNLGNGWGAPNYPFPPDHQATTPADTAARYVYGVEEQQLCFSEGHAIYAESVEDEDSMSNPKDKIDFGGTEWDDVIDHQFLFFELQNVSPREVSFNNESWQVVVRPLQRSAGAPTTTTGSVVGPERRLVFTANAPNVGTGANNRFTVGTVGDEGGTVPRFPAGGFPSPPTPAINATEPGPSRFMVDPQYRLGAPAPERISPSMPIAFDGSAIDEDYLDLLLETGQYRIFEGDDNDVSNDTPPPPPAPDPQAFDERDGMEITSSSTNPSGAQLLKFTNVPDLDANEYQVELVLRRRMNPYRYVADPTNAAQSLDNPWVVVDRFQVSLKQFFLEDDSVTGTEIVDAIDGTSLDSLERVEPLYADPDPSSNALAAATYGAVNTYRANTIGEENENAPAGPYNTWHPHFNRPYSSLAEVFNVPLYGPDRLYGPHEPPTPQDKLVPVAPADWRGVTVKLGSSVAGGFRLTGRQRTQSELATTFGERVLNPTGVTIGMMSNVGANDWYRLLEFIEAPSRMNRSLEPQPYRQAGHQLIGSVNGSQAVTYRDAGALNPNTLATSLNFGALLDDSSVIQVPTPPTTGAAVRLPDQGGNGPAPVFDPINGFYDWWQVFMASRDGINDPVHPGDLPLPGVPGWSVPFRPYSTFTNGVPPIERTVIRSNPVDAAGSAPIRNRHLFELGTLGQVESPDRTQDYAFRHRLLNKVMNHTTTQSNTFIVFLQTDYFRATEVNDGFGGTVVQIHEKLPTSPGYRGFFVIDRSLAPELLRPEDIPNRSTARTFSFNPNFDWRALIVHRQRLN